VLICSVLWVHNSSRVDSRDGENEKNEEDEAIADDEVADAHADLLPAAFVLDEIQKVDRENVVEGGDRQDNGKERGATTAGQDT